MNHVFNMAKDCGRIIDHHLLFRFNNDPVLRNNMSVSARIAELAVNLFVVISGVISFLAFPELTIVGFVAGHIFRNHVRRDLADLWSTFQKVDYVTKGIISLFIFVSWPYLYLMSPVIIGSYMGWSANERRMADNWFFYP